MKLLNFVLIAALAVGGAARVGATEPLAESSVVATGEGRFSGSDSVEAGADGIAALEQQAFREFRWDVVVPAKISMEFEVTVGGDAPIATAQLMASLDGEIFQPLPPETVVEAGRVISVIVTQISLEQEGGLSFPASEWGFEVIATPTPALEGDVVGPVLIPIAFGDDLGCTTTGCGEGAQGAELPAVDGQPKSSPGTSASVDTSDTELAQQLQTELARVGCYSMAIDGLWGPGSRKAMAAFNSAKGADLTAQIPTATALVAVAKEQEAVCNP